MSTLTKKEFFSLIETAKPGTVLFKAELEKKYNKKYPKLRKGAVADQLSRFTKSGHLERLRGQYGIYRIVTNDLSDICDQIISLVTRLKQEL